MSSNATFLRTGGPAVVPATPDPLLDCERLDVYRVALEFQALGPRLLPRRGYAALRDQLERQCVRAAEHCGGLRTDRARGQGTVLRDLAWKHDGVRGRVGPAAGARPAGPRASPPRPRPVGASDVAREYGVARILQVAYLRPSSWESLEINGTSQPIPEAVISHFRRVQNITRLSAGPRIEVLDCPFTDRSTYMAEVSAAVGGAPCETSLVFLDPDTGLAPKNPTLDHVLEAEARDIWQTMRPRDVLVFYQHETNKAGLPWVEPKRQQFERALGLDRGCAKLAWAPKVARDIAFFYCVKDEPEHAAGTA